MRTVALLAVLVVTGCQGGATQHVVAAPGAVTTATQDQAAVIARIDMDKTQLHIPLKADIQTKAEVQIASPTIGGSNDSLWQWIAACGMWLVYPLVWRPTRNWINAPAPEPPPPKP